MVIDSNGLSSLDANQVIKSTARTTESGGVATGTVILNSLVPSEYDQITLTYVAAGNGAGEVETATYKLNSVTVATLTLTYDASDRVIDVIRS